MNVESIQSVVLREVATQVGRSVADVKLTDSLAADLGFDSLDTIELMMAAEDEFGIEISDDKLSSVKTPQDIVDLVTKAREAA